MTLNLIQNEYRYNTYFKRFVDEFCRTHDCTVEDALKDDQIRKKFWMYTEV